MNTSPQNMSSLTRRVLRTSAAAEYVGLSKSTLEKARVTGSGPKYLKLGKVVVYDLLDLNEWLEGHRRDSTSAD